MTTREFLTAIATSEDIANIAPELTEEAGVRIAKLDAANAARKAKADLASFLNERWKGMAPIAWGDTLRESEFTMWLYDGVCGLTSANNTK